MDETLLGGLRVVEIADHLTEHAGRILASVGAEVWLVEPPGGAWTRRRRPAVPGADESERGSLAFLARNQNKRSLVIDPSTPGDLRVLAELIARSDVVIDTETSPLHDAVAGAAGDAARITITDRLGLGRSPMVGFAAGGGMSSTGWPHQPPCAPPSFLTHDCAGIYAATMAVAAHWVRHRHDARVDYEVAYEEAATAATTPWTRVMHSAETHVGGQGIISERQADGPYPIIEASDGFVRFLAATPRQWHGLVELLGSPEELTDGPWADRAFRRDNWDLLTHVLSQYSPDMTMQHLFIEGQARNVTITPLQTPGEFRADPHVVERGIFAPVDDPEHGEMVMVRPPLVAEPPSILPDVSAAPALDDGRQDLAAVLAEEPRPPAKQADIDPRVPFAGMRILQLGSGAVVPEACSLFALLGAQVIRIESQVYVDFLRRRPLDPDNIDDVPTYNQLNLGVESLAVDMSTLEGAELVKRLVPHCDLVVENMRAPVVERWGLAHEEARLERDDIVSLSSQGLGRGPYGKYQTFGPNLVAFSGKAWLWSHPDDPHPVGSTLPHPDHTAGKQAFIGLVGALVRRDRGHGGCFVEAAQVEAPAWHVADRLLELELHGEIAPWGNWSPDMAPHGCYPCADDRWIAIAVEDDRQWLAFCDVVGPGAGVDPALGSASARLAATDELNALIGEWTSGQQVAVVEASLRQAGIPCARVVNGDDMAADADAHESGFFATLEHKTAGPRTYTGLPVRSVTAGRPATRLAPLLGEHTDEILTGILGLDQAAIADLRDRRIVGY
ncbi:MAG: CoA transferase [Actinomycetota bacterium]